MSRLTELLAQAKAKDAALGIELELEFKALSARRAFGLNFERHKPVSVELPGRPVRKGDKVRILPLRGSSAKEDHRFWKVLDLEGKGDARRARLEQLGSDAPEPKFNRSATLELKQGVPRRPIRASASPTTVNALPRRGWD